MECFADHVRHSRTPPITSSTINCYLTHINDWFVTSQILSSPFPIRNQRLNFLLQNYSNIDFETNPTRQKTAVPFTYSLLCETLIYISSLSISLNTRALIKAAFALGYACSLRTSQYLKGSHSTPLRKQCNSSVSFSGSPIYHIVFVIQIYFLLILFPTRFHVYYNIPKTTKMVLVVQNQFTVVWISLLREIVSQFYFDIYMPIHLPNNPLYSQMKMARSTHPSISVPFSTIFPTNMVFNVHN